MVIQQLPEVLRDPVCIFYLVLRALDTIEDDMALPVKTKLPLLLAFHEHIFDRYKHCHASLIIAMQLKYSKFKTHSVRL